MDNLSENTYIEIAAKKYLYPLWKNLQIKIYTSEDVSIHSDTIIYYKYE